MRMNPRDKRKWFAVHFGNSYFKSNPIASPMLPVIGLIIPIMVVTLVVLFALDHQSAGARLAETLPILAASQRLEGLAKKIRDLQADYDGLMSRSATENRRMTDEERTRATQLLGEIRDYSAEQTILQNEIEVREKTNQSMRSPIRPSVESEDEIQRRYSARGIKLPNRENRFGNFGEFIRAAIEAEPQVRGKVDPRLTRAAAGMGESSPVDGGFLVQPDMSDRLVEPLFAQNGDAILSRVNTTPVTGNGLSFNAIDETTKATSTWGGIAMYWLGEGSEKTPSAPKLRKIELKLKKVAGMLYLTDELIQDAPAASARLERGFQIALRNTLIKAIISGTGAGQPLGLLNSSAKISISKETGQDAATIVLDNVLNMRERLTPGALNPVWLYNPTAYKQLFKLQVALGAAGALVSGATVQGPPMTSMLGIPLVECPWCSVLGTAGDLILSDLGQYEFIQKGGPEIAYSVHVRFIYDETAMRVVYRCDGMPAQISAVTLEDGSTTASPIVVLETRS